MSIPAQTAPDPLSSQASQSWRLRPPAPPAAVATICRALGLPPLLAGVLWSRGLGDKPSEALAPPLSLTPIPALMEAAEKLEEALRGHKRILIHGDYDADGITGTAILTLALRALGGNVFPFIPNRLEDGYGISLERIEEHAARADLFVTVDCGISNLAEIAALQASGVEVIVTDHHTPGATLPECLVVHPRHSLHPDAPVLTGAGVAYHLLWALHERLGLEAPLDYSDLAAVGTIADVAPLLGENRALVQEGLKRLKDSKWPGLKACVNRNLAGREPSARDVAFVIAPRLNAAGRMGEADFGLELLTTASQRRARELAVYLDARNIARRKVQDEMLEEAMKLVDPLAPALVLESPSWHPGVMGIVASKLLERFYRPVFIMAQGKGSVRSTPGISAVKALDSASAHLKRYGGHSQAAGFAIEDGRTGDFRQAIYAFVERCSKPERSVTVDALLHPQDITPELLAAVATLEPYGEGHPAPLFALTDSVRSARAVGRGGKHLQLRLSTIKGVAWSKGELAPGFGFGTRLDAAVSLQENEWQGERSIEFVAQALRPAARFSYSLSHGGEAPCTSRLIRRLDPHAPLDDLLRAASTGVYPAQPGRANAWRPGDAVPDSLILFDLPLDDDPLRACRPLLKLLASP
ncbi:MAG: single-stranded-DNA-specific exonuclease RecJ, partial [Deinococcota bacterium]|nr:single-stranded-DNA-specific exonuclease RecJ [Deinococcota bacterium]